VGYLVHDQYVQVLLVDGVVDVHVLLLDVSLVTLVLLALADGLGLALTLLQVQHGLREFQPLGGDFLILVAECGVHGHHQFLLARLIVDERAQEFFELLPLLLLLDEVFVDLEQLASEEIEYVLEDFSGGDVVALHQLHDLVLDVVLLGFVRLELEQLLAHAHLPLFKLAQVQ